MFGDTLTITTGGSGGENRVLNKLTSNKPYTSEYFLNAGSGNLFYATIRHSVEGTPRTGYAPLGRHTITVRQESGSGTPDDLKIIKECTLIVRGSDLDSPAYVVDLGQGLALWMTETNLGKLLGGE